MVLSNSITQMGENLLTREEKKMLAEMVVKMRNGNRGRGVKGSADLGFLKGR
jgi:hypothetical protein